MGNTFARNKSLFFFLIGLVVLFAVVYFLWEPLLPFFIGFLIAYMLHPIVGWIQKKLPAVKGKRGEAIERIAIIIVAFLIILALIAGIIYLMIVSISGPFAQMIANAPTLITDGLEKVGDWFQSVIKDLTASQQAQINQAVNNIGESLGTWLQNAFASIVPRIFSTVTFIFGFFILPFFLILFMSNIPTLGRQFYSMFSPGIGYHVRNFFRILDTVFGRYIRASILAGIIMGIIVVILFLILDIPLAIPQGVIFGAFQLIPTIGGAIASVIGVILVLATDPSQLLAAIIVFIVMNLVVSTVLIAKLHGSAVRMDPSIIMILIVVGGFLGGVLGMILIVPIIAVVYALYKYVRDEIKRNQIEDNNANPPPSPNET
jgi:predicted PurR-regulated permease PerM